MNKKLFAQELVKIAQMLVGIEFDSQEAMDAYLKEHPDADKSNHSVKKTEEKKPEGEKKEEKPVEKKEEPKKEEKKDPLDVAKHNRHIVFNHYKSLQKTEDEIYRAGNSGDSEKFESVKKGIIDKLEEVKDKSPSSEHWKVSDAIRYMKSRTMDNFREMSSMSREKDILGRDRTVFNNKIIKPVEQIQNLPSKKFITQEEKPAEKNEEPKKEEKKEEKPAEKSSRKKMTDEEYSEAHTKETKRLKNMLKEKYGKGKKWNELSSDEQEKHFDDAKEDVSNGIKALLIEALGYKNWDDAYEKGMTQELEKYINKSGNEQAEKLLKTWGRNVKRQRKEKAEKSKSEGEKKEESK